MITTFFLLFKSEQLLTRKAGRKYRNEHNEKRLIINWYWKRAKIYEILDERKCTSKQTSARMIGQEDSKIECYEKVCTLINEERLTLFSKEMKKTPPLTAHIQSNASDAQAPINVCACENTRNIIYSLEFKLFILRIRNFGYANKSFFFEEKNGLKQIHSFAIH